MIERIPQCSPLAGYRAQATEIEAAIQATLDAGRYILGPRVAGFEELFARWVGVPHALGVASGTDALEIALRAVGVGPGDLVITPSMSAVATAAAIRKAGAAPVFADIDEHTALIKPSDVEQLLRVYGQRIRAIVPVHLYGRCADMDSLMRIAQQHEVPLVEDCAQAHGAAWHGRKAGSFGALSAFSFYPTKNLGAIGDGGAVLTSNPELFDRARLLREYGWRTRYISAIEGGNSRLDELQAAILEVKLARLTEDNAARRQIAGIYRAGIQHSEIKVCKENDDGHVYHQFVVCANHREALQTYLAAEGIGTLVHYPAAIHQQPAYAVPAFTPLPLPNTERWASRVLSLPMYPQMQTVQASRVVEVINRWVAPR
jgi:dTDP-4-amino-4,6-dideoxygalactose transaminase